MAALRAVWYWWLIPVVVTYILLMPVKKNGFVSFDDSLYVTENKLIIEKEFSLKHYFSLSSIVASNYHPLTMLTLRYDYSAAGYDAAQYHSTNLIIHILNTFLVFVFIYFVLIKNVLAAALTSVIFGIHPMHVESVAWISERKDMLYVFFFLISLLLYYKFKKDGSIGAYALSIAVFVCALLSKGMAVSLPIVIIVIDFYKGERSYKKLFLNKIPFLILALIFGLYAYYVQRVTDALAGEKLGNLSYSVYENICHSCYSVLVYGINFLYPHNQSAYIVFPELYDNANITPGYMFWMPVLFLFVLGVTWLLRKKEVLIFGLAFFYVTIFLVSQIIMVGSTIVSERYTYLAYIGLSFPFGVWLGEINERKNKFYRYKNIVNAIVLVWGLWLCSSTLKRVGVWKNSDTLWSDVIDKLERPALVPYQYRSYYLVKKSFIDKNNVNSVSSQSDYLRAINDIKVAISMVPSSSPGEEGLMSDLAAYYGFVGEYSMSVKTYDELIQKNPKKKEYYYNKIAGLIYLKDRKEEYKTYCDELKYFPNDTALLIQRARLSIDENHPDTTIKDCNYLLSINPNNYRYYLYRGTAYINKNNYKEALSDLNKAMSFHPNDGYLFNNMSVLFFNMGDKKQAYNFAIKAISLGTPVTAEYIKMCKQY